MLKICYYVSFGGNFPSSYLRLDWTNRIVPRHSAQGDWFLPEEPIITIPDKHKSQLAFNRHSARSHLTNSACISVSLVLLPV